MAGGAGDQKQESGMEEHTDVNHCVCRVDIPNDVMVTIMQNFPFPHCFKARLLHREWHLQFQERMIVVSHTWPTYCPALLSPGGELNAYDRPSNRWHTMKFASVQKLDRRNTYGVFGPAPAGVLEGVLFCTLGTSREGVNATILNLLSGKKNVISCPLQGRCLPVFSSIGVDRYHLLLLGQETVEGKEFEPKLSVHRYESSSHSWVQNSLAHGRLAHLIRYLPHLGRLSHTFLDGNLYWYYRKTKSRTFLVYRTNLEDGTESESLSVTLEFELSLESLTFELLKSGSRIIVVVTWRSGESPESRTGASICELEKETFKLMQLSTSPQSLWPAYVESADSALDIKSAADNEFIYLYSDHVVSYHLDSGTWNSHGPLPASAHNQCNHRMLHKKLCRILCVKFEPGLNPFVVP